MHVVMDSREGIGGSVESYRYGARVEWNEL